MFFGQQPQNRVAGVSAGESTTPIHAGALSRAANGVAWQLLWPDGPPILRSIFPFGKRYPAGYQ